MIDQDPVMAVAFGPDGKTILSAHLSGSAKLWDVSSTRLVGQPFHL